MNANPTCTPVKNKHVPPVTIQMENLYEADPVESNKTQTMKLYLNDELIELNTHLTLQIMELITSHAINSSQKIDTDADVQNEDRVQFEYVLDVDDTPLRSMVGDTNAQKIKQIVESKLMLALINIACFGVVILEYTFGADSLLFNVYSNTIFCILMIPWLIFKHLLFNQVAGKLCIHTFDFWIKVGYGFMFSVADIFLAVFDSNGFKWKNIRECTQLGFTVLSISYISSFDAVYTTKTKKCVVCTFMALLFSWWAIQTQFLSTDEEDFKIETQLSNGMNIISMHSFMANSSRVLAIFFWKQSYKTWKSTGRAVTILKAPKLTWTNVKAMEHNLADVVNRSIEIPPQNTKTIPVIDQSTIRTEKCTSDNATSSSESKECSYSP